MAEERFDGILLSLAQQHEGGVPALLDTLFSFLQRKTDFFTGGKPGQAQELLLNSFKKYESKSFEERRKSDERQAAVRKQREEDERQAAAAVRKQREEEDERQAAAAAARKQMEDELKKEKQQEQTPVEPKQQDLVKEPKQDEESEGEGKVPNSGNGSSTDNYIWTQTLQEVDVRFLVPSGTKARQLIVDIKPNRLKVGLKGQPPLVDEQLEKSVKAGDATWVLEDNKCIMLTLPKQNDMEWWSRLVTTEEPINTRKIQPESSKLEDLDGETRGMVEKMMFDSRQKAMGLPTSEDMKKQELIQKFMQQHPEMDFSQAKIS